MKNRESLKELCLILHELKENLAAEKSRTRKLLENPPSKANLDTVGNIERLIDYKFAIDDSKEKTDQLEQQIKSYSEKATTLLKIAEVPPGKKFDVPFAEKSSIEVWYDTEGNITSNGPISHS
ncbi:hypothetical protein [Mucilaginibacter sp. NFR10]|uniref:hypothetical protein n=1 Tax=Mucilaginibacter sp. NFR10 TaxID=1566292 RepID=UPI0008712F0C|nr:hypothetical protein [Mucilaginibacter sp. NFR10]SCW53722.1 hypothetical protein SAMN03159284_01582 [Mucilaginibacter sp. NFR10]